MGRDITPAMLCMADISFNPRARMGRDELGLGKSGKMSVSIHAPAWGATKDLTRSSFNNIVSIHAPAWGATHKINKLSLSNKFQSTRPHGARLVKINER